MASNTPSVLDWEPSQSKHSHYCGMQGPHSVGHGQKGSCTCGRDELVAENQRLRQALLHIEGYGITPNNGYPVVSADVVKVARKALRP